MTVYVQMADQAISPPLAQASWEYTGHQGHTTPATSALGGDDRQDSIISPVTLCEGDQQELIPFML